MQKNILLLALFSSGFYLLDHGLDFIDKGSQLIRLFSNYFFPVTFIASIYFLFKKKWIGIVVHIAALFLVAAIPDHLQTDVNFYMHKEKREELVEMLKDGTIKKEPDIYGNKGFFNYRTPEGYETAVRSATIRAAKHSDEVLYVFFQSADVPVFKFDGLEEGFVYSSTGEFPSPKKFNSYYYGYKKIDDNWYFVSDDEDRLREMCVHYCGEIIND